MKQAVFIITCFLFLNASAQELITELDEKKLQTSYFTDALNGWGIDRCLSKTTFASSVQNKVEEDYKFSPDRSKKNTKESDTSILNGIGIGNLQLGSNYEIVLSSASCYSRGSLVIKITKEYFGYSLVGHRRTTSKYEKKKWINYKVTQLSNEQLDSLRSFEALVGELIRQEGLSVQGSCRGRTSYSINQDGKIIYFNEIACESRIYPILKPLLIEEEN